MEVVSLGLRSRICLLRLKTVCLTPPPCNVSVSSGHSDCLDLCHLGSPTVGPAAVYWQKSFALEFELQSILSPRLTTTGLTDAKVAPASFASETLEFCLQPGSYRATHPQTIFISTGGLLRWRGRQWRRKESQVLMYYFSVQQAFIDPF